MEARSLSLHRLLHLQLDSELQLVSTVSKSQNGTPPHAPPRIGKPPAAKGSPRTRLLAGELKYKKGGLEARPPDPCLWKTRVSRALETSLDCQAVENFTPTRAFSRWRSVAMSYRESGWETGGTICAVARCSAIWPACCRNFANATRQTPYATRTPKASDASAAHINISIFTASCISRILSSVWPRVLHRLD